MEFFYPHTATIKQYSGVTQNSEGTIIPSALITYKEDVKCDLQITSNDQYTMNEYGISGVQSTHIVYIDPDPNLTRGKTFFIIDDTTYEVVGAEKFSTHYEVYVNESVVQL